MLLAPSFAFAHARLKASNNIVIRSNNAGIKTGPCGGVARAAIPADLVGGQKVTVNWEETIQHPGRYEFYFSESGDTNFKLLATVVDTQDDSATLPHQYSVELTMPDISCTACTLQMIQVMTENPANPRNYYSCADIKLTSTTPVPPVPPTPPEDCN